jgi:hypothetical protein
LHIVTMLEDDGYQTLHDFGVEGMLNYEKEIGVHFSPYTSSGDFLLFQGRLETEYRRTGNISSSLSFNRIVYRLHQHMIF